MTAPVHARNRTWWDQPDDTPMEPNPLLPNQAAEWQDPQVQFYADDHKVPQVPLHRLPAANPPPLEDPCPCVVL